jgi:hypothetical protein
LDPSAPEVEKINQRGASFYLPLSGSIPSRIIAVVIAGVLMIALMAVFSGTLLTGLTYLPVARSIALDIPEVETPDWHRLCPYLILSSANTLVFLRLNDMTCGQPPRDRINPPSQFRTPSLLTDHRVF